MAPGACHVEKWDLHHSRIDDYPKKRVSPSPKQNMKEDNLSQGESLGNGNQQLYKVVVFKRKAQSPAFRRKQHLRGWDCDMANKENELAGGNLQDKLQNDRHTFVLNSSDSGSTQAEGASKYSSFFTEVSKDHEIMSQVLFSRNLRLNVALTFWRKHSVNELVAYLVRMQDLGVIADCLPVLTNSLQEDKASVSIGGCVDLLPLVKSLLKSKFEEYVIVGLNWLQAIVKKWWTQLSTSSENSLDENVLILKHQLSGMWLQESYLASVPGYTGNIAKDLDGYLSQLH
ncbi:PREDICTED: KATNB1-like protein 1 isoform X2 [Nanorana parkeri]|uniref:KATNB1-like protein 1 isoform X2 n=1 Tax=Nanorana parkeri TaxID=125878 RepID=UPI000854FFD8|nr:PREDICTED: KATNB1-like protein 1 isoform X2 [Nanorana parkeri]